MAVGCLLDGQPFPGAWVRVTAGMVRKNPLASLHGPADAAGIIRLTGRDLMDWARQSVRLAIMDYGDPSREWSGELSVEPVGLVSIEKALVAHSIYASSGSFPAGYEAGLGVLKGRLEQVKDGELAVRILSVQPPNTYAVTAPGGARQAVES